MSQVSAPTSVNLTGSFTPEAFEAHLARVKHLPAWWLDRKRAAYARFASLPMPKRTDEGWRFSNFAALTLDGFQVGRVVPDEPSSVRGPGLAFLNNAATGAAPAAPAQGVIFDTLQHALLQHGDLIKAHLLTQPSKLGSGKFAALHEAFLEDGAFVFVPKGVEVAEPFIVRHGATGAGTAVFPHTLVVLDEGAKATVVDFFASDAGGFACGGNDLHASHAASLTYIAVQDWHRDTLSFQFNAITAKRDTQVKSLNLHLGARQARHESYSQLQAPGAHSEMLALTVAQGAQEFDQRTLQIHQAPHTSSNLLYKNALLDTAKTIFSGLIVVDPDAQKTDAYQSNRNLMLSDEAEAHSLPGLEIQANDVRCTHGATSARVDAEQEFYLEARGIKPAQARELLVFGFFEEVLGKIENQDLHDNLAAVIRSKFKK